MYLQRGEKRSLIVLKRKGKKNRKINNGYFYLIFIIIILFMETMLGGLQLSEAGSN